MIGFATVHANNNKVAVWLTSNVENCRAGHTNAVVIERTDEALQRKIEALIADRIVIALEAVQVPGLVREPLGVAGVNRLRREVEARRDLLVAVIEDYRKRTRRKLVLPTWVPLPDELPGDVESIGAGLVEQTLAAANVFARFWTGWLETEDERLRRRENTKGKPSGILPEELSSKDVEVLPASFVSGTTGAFAEVSRRG